MTHTKKKTVVTAACQGDKQQLSTETNQVFKNWLTQLRSILKKVPNTKTGSLKQHAASFSFCNVQLLPSINNKNQTFLMMYCSTLIPILASIFSFLTAMSSRNISRLWLPNDSGIDSFSTGPLARSLVRSHRSLIPLLQTARFARTLRCAHSFAHSLTSSLVGQ